MFSDVLSEDQLHMICLGLFTANSANLKYEVVYTKIQKSCITDADHELYIINKQEKKLFH